MNKLVDPMSGKSTIAGNDPAIEAPAELKTPERSFAQPSPAAPAKEVKPKSHASKNDEDEALKRNSTKKPEAKTETVTEPVTDEQVG